jgi:alpha/beta superfamily hydrolase
MSSRILRPACCLLPAVGLLFAGCMSLDSFLFEQTRVAEYFQPGDMLPEWNTRYIIPDSLIEPVVLNSMGDSIYGFFVHANGLDPVRNSVTMLYHHGHSYNINRYWGRVELLWEMGYQVFIYDYHGYGRSQGEPSGAACYSDARAALAYCLTRPDVDSTRLVYYGWSLGSFMGTYLASDVRSPTVLVLETPLASTSALVREGTLLDVPGDFFAKADFDNERRITEVGAPAVIFYAEHDSTARPDRHVQSLIDILKANNRTYQAYSADCGHVAVPWAISPLYTAVMKDTLLKWLDGR